FPNASMVTAVPALATTQAPEQTPRAPINAAQRSTPSCDGCSYRLNTPACERTLHAQRGSTFQRAHSALSFLLMSSPATLPITMEDGRGSPAHCPSSLSNS